MDVLLLYCLMCSQLFILPPPPKKKNTNEQRNKEKKYKTSKYTKPNKNKK